jgi:hypothetical protein
MCIKYNEQWYSVADKDFIYETIEFWELAELCRIIVASVILLFVLMKIQLFPVQSITYGHNTIKYLRLRKTKQSDEVNQETRLCQQTKETQKP